MPEDPLGFAIKELSQLAKAGLYRRVRSLSSTASPSIAIGGRSYLHFASNNYLGLADDPRVVRASVEAAQRWGAGTGSARLITGSMILHDELEHELATFKRKESALLFSSGYLANLGTITALIGPEDEIFSDALNHASIVDGARLSKATVRIFRHADAEHLLELLQNSTARRKLVVTDAIFSMDGDAAPLAEIVDVAEKFDAIVMVDEAHATGVVGPDGRGLVAALNLEDRVHIIMGTLSKALGSSGGYIAGSASLIDLLRNKARSFIFDTAPVPASAGSALCALRLVQSEPQRREQIRFNALRLAAGLNVPSPVAAIVPIIIGPADRAELVSRLLFDEGIVIPAIRPPSVPAGTSRLRATVMATHESEHVDAFVRAFDRVTASV